jgi:flagellar motor protein MotB
MGLASALFLVLALSSIADARRGERQYSALEEPPSFSQSVIPNLSGAKVSTQPSSGEEQTRVWDSEEGEGSTIVLTNRNSLEAQELQTQQQINILAVLKAKHDKEKADEQAEKALEIQQQQQIEANLRAQAQKIAQDYAAAQKIINQKCFRRMDLGQFPLRPGKLFADGAVLPANPQATTSSNSYTIMFWVKPIGVVSDWGSLLLRGDDDSSRFPHVYFYPSTTRLGVQSTDQKKGLGQAVPDPQPSLQLNTWTHVAVTHAQGALKVYINGNVASTTKGIQAPQSTFAPIYTCSPYKSCANALMADVRYCGSALEQGDIVKIAQDTSSLTQSASSQ